MEKGTLIDHVERLRAQPEHVRHRIAIGTTFGITGIVAVVWLFGIVRSGSLELSPFTQANSNGAPNSVNGTVAASGDQTSNPSGISQLLGAVGASGGNSNPPSLTAEDVSTTSNTNQSAQQSVPPTGGNQTVIPF